jgi:hypothetical protein
MNKIINIKIQNADQTGFQNIHINEINNIPDYSVDVLRFAELNVLAYNLCETIIVQLLNKIRPQTGICVIEILDMLALSNGYVNKMIDSAAMSQAIEKIHNSIGLIDIKNIIEKYNNTYSIVKINKNPQNTTIAITLQRNSI